MTLVRWNSWQEMDTLRQYLDRLFDDAVTPATCKGMNGLMRVPAAELKETVDALYLKLEIPGVDAKELDIEVTADAVSISGERKSETQPEDEGTTRSEFHYGKFQRVIPLPAKVQNTNVTAEYKDGILHLTLPKTDAEKHKVVKVNIG